jgi:hypothetical protein
MNTFGFDARDLWLYHDDTLKFLATARRTNNTMECISQIVSVMKGGYICWTN